MLALGEILGLDAEEIVVEPKVLDDHLGVEEVLLVDVHIDHLIAVLGVARQIVLDRADVVVDEVLAPADIAREAAHPVVHDDHVGLKGMDQIVQGTQRRDPSAGGDIDVSAEGADPGLRIALRIGVDRDVALVQMGDHGLGQGARRGGVGDLPRRDRLL